MISHFKPNWNYILKWQNFFLFANGKNFSISSWKNFSYDRKNLFRVTPKICRIENVGTSKYWKNWIYLIFRSSSRKIIKAVKRQKSQRCVHHILKGNFCIDFFNRIPKFISILWQCGTKKVHQRDLDKFGLLQCRSPIESFKNLPRGIPSFLFGNEAFQNEAFWKASFPMFWTSKVGLN